MSALVGWLVALPPWLVLAAAFVLPALEALAFLGLLVPGETALIVGGVVAHGGALSLWTVIAAGVTGAALGDQIGYRLGARFGQRLLVRLPRRSAPPGSSTGHWTCCVGVEPSLSSSAGGPRRCEP